MAVTVSIMQPYFFPYIGYFQLIHQSDAFVLYDDVQYIRSGWSNRNRILRDCVPHYLTFPVEKDDYRLTYTERRYCANAENRERVLRSVIEAYKFAPQFDTIMPVIFDLMAFPDPTISEFNANIIRRLCTLLDVRTRILRSSDMPQTRELSGTARVIAICQQLAATRYVNTSGGEALYDGAEFSRHGLELGFTRARSIVYDQGCQTSVTGLSIIDVLMHNSITAVRAMLEDYERI